MATYYLSWHIHSCTEEVNTKHWKGSVLWAARSQLATTPLLYIPSSSHVAMGLLFFGVILTLKDCIHQFGMQLHSLFVYLWITKQSQFCRTLTSLYPGARGKTKLVSKLYGLYGLHKKSLVTSILTISPPFK